jgi:hypothetical protein
LERRIHERLNLYERVHLRVIALPDRPGEAASGPDTADEIPGCIADLSPGGAGIEIPRWIPSGSLVEIRNGRFMLLAEVRHCDGKDPGPYLMGVSFGHSLRRAEVNELAGGHAL